MQSKMPSTFEKILLGLVLILANLRALVFIFLFPDTSKLLGPAWIEILLWILSGMGFAYLLVRDHQRDRYLATWRGNGPLVIFLLFAFGSIAWSIGPVVTLFRALELFFATLIAAYIGMQYRAQKIMDVLFWFGAGMLILSIALVFGAPKSGTMYWAPFDGAWRGVYWHRNHLASIAALLSAIYLCRAWLAFQARNDKAVLDVFFYIFSLVSLYFAKSVTGYIVFIVLHGFILIVLIWLRFYHRLQRQHYLAILGLTVLAGILILTNLDFVFALFHRDTSMTGRVGLWKHLLDMAAPRRWLGHGFGAVWTFDSFREQIRVLVGWTSQPLIGDNGFLDLYLHLGIVGLLLFLTVFITAIVRSVRYALTRKTLLGFFPLLLMTYAFFANISFSLFSETEVFVWMLIVIVLFMTMPLSNTIYAERSDSRV